MGHKQHGNAGIKLIVFHREGKISNFQSILEHEYFGIIQPNNMKLSFCRLSMARYWQFLMVQFHK